MTFFWWHHQILNSSNSIQWQLWKNSNISFTIDDGLVSFIGLLISDDNIGAEVDHLTKKCIVLAKLDSYFQILISLESMILIQSWFRPKWYKDCVLLYKLMQFGLKSDCILSFKPNKNCSWNVLTEKQLKWSYTDTCYHYKSVRDLPTSSLKSTMLSCLCVWIN